MDKNEREFIRLHFLKSEAERKAQEEFLKTKIAVRIKVILEGFKHDQAEIKISDNLRIKWAPLEEREEFYRRAANLMNSPWLPKEHEFFAEFDFEVPRRELNGLAPSEATTTVGCFIAICGSEPFNINKGQFYALKEEPTSLGVHMMPYEMNNPPKVSYKDEDIARMTELWPAFLPMFSMNQWFALICRRFFYSTLKFTWEDKLVDLLISLEALLIDDKEREKKERLASRTARLLESELSGDVKTRVLDCYSLRNDIVHGTVTRPHPFVQEDVNELSMIVKSAIRVYLRKYPGMTSGSLIAALRI